MPDIGALDRRVRFDRRQSAPDGTGGVMAGGYAPISPTIWARRVDVSDVESFAADEKAAVLRARFVVFSSKATRAVTAKDFIWHDGVYWEILGKKETSEGRSDFLEFTAAVRSDSDG